MNILDLLLHPSVSPIPDDPKTKILLMALQKLKGVPQDVAGSLQSAANISPPLDLMHRLETNKAYIPYGGVPYQEQTSQNIGNIKNAVDAMKLVGYASTLRPFVSNPLNLVNGQSARLLNSGRGWSIFDRVLNQ